MFELGQKIGKYIIVDPTPLGEKEDSSEPKPSVVLRVREQGDDPQKISAMKIVNQYYIGKYRERYRREVETLKRLQPHPGVIPLRESGVEESIPYIVLKYVPGGSLQHKYPGASRPTDEEIISYVKQISSVLQYMHEEHHIAHSDIKPQNILVDEDRHLLLTDFDVAVELNSSLSHGFRTQTTRGYTPLYAAPEQFRRIDPIVTAQSDQYSLAVIVYKWLCGWFPFGQDGEIPCEISRQVKRVLRKALSDNYEKRYENISEFAQDLEQALCAPDFPNRRVVVVGLSTTGLALIGGVTWLVISQTSRSSSTASPPPPTPSPQIPPHAGQSVPPTPSPQIPPHAGQPGP